LSIANIAEQHEVWDFLSASSKVRNLCLLNSNCFQYVCFFITFLRFLALHIFHFVELLCWKVYLSCENLGWYTYSCFSFLEDREPYMFFLYIYFFCTVSTVNVDDAMDDIVRQFKGVSDGLKRAVGTSPSAATSQLVDNRMSLSWNQDETYNNNLHHRNLGSTHSLSDGDSNCVDLTSSVNSGCHLDNEVNDRGTSNDTKNVEVYPGLDAQVSEQLGKPVRAYSDSSNLPSLNTFEDPTGIPPEVH
jgi:hypothetical protein